MGQAVFLLPCFLRATRQTLNSIAIGTSHPGGYLDIAQEAVRVCHHFFTPTPPLPTEQPSIEMTESTMIGMSAPKSPQMNRVITNRHTPSATAYSPYTHIHTHTHTNPPFSFLLTNLPLTHSLSFPPCSIPFLRVLIRWTRFIH